MSLVHIDGERFSAALEALGATLQKTTTDVLKETAEYTKRQADETTLYNDRSGKLRSATQTFEWKSGLHAGIVNKTKYAKFIENGTRPHVIAARRAPFLHFFWAKEGRWVTTKKVNHPGTQQRPFFARAGEYGGRHLSRLLDRMASWDITHFNQAK